MADFEEDFTNWYHNEDARGHSEITTTEVYEGSKAVSVTSNTGGWTATYQRLSFAEGFEKGYNYFVTMKCKTNIGHNCYTFLGSDVDYGIYATSGLRAGTGNWETLYASLYMPSDTPPTTTHIGVYVYGQNPSAGTTYYDSIKLYKYK